MAAFTSQTAYILMNLKLSLVTVAQFRSLCQHDFPVLGFVKCLVCFTSLPSWRVAALVASISNFNRSVRNKMPFFKNYYNYHFKSKGFLIFPVLAKMCVPHQRIKTYNSIGVEIHF